MAHVVTERCVDCRYTDCCAVCPVDCFYEIGSPAMLVIDPVTCIDCGLCIPECPIQAIWPEDELPEEYSDWTDKNAELFSDGTVVTEKTNALPGAVSLAQLQERERQRGWNVIEPSGVDEEAASVASESESVTVPAAQGRIPAKIDNPLPAPDGITKTQASVFDATANTLYRWRTVRSVARDVQLPQGTVQGDLERLVDLGHIQKRAPKTRGSVVYGEVGRVAG